MFVLDSEIQEKLKIRKLIEKAIIDMATGCWLWQGAKDGSGYGKISINNKETRLHRHVYEVLKEEIQFGLVIDHLCYNKNCFCPDHLEQVTVKENNRRAKEKYGLIPPKEKIFDQISYDYFYKLLEPCGLSSNKRHNLAKLILLDYETGCWNWQGSIDVKGYGRYDVGNDKPIGAHRFIFKILKDDLIPGLVIDHICRNRRCVNIDHLRQVTQRENALENSISTSAINITKIVCQNGHPYDENNTYFMPSGGRACRKCHVEWSKEGYQKKKEVMIADGWTSSHNKDKTHCKNGHELTEDNIYTTVSIVKGKEYIGRSCKPCALIRSEKQREDAKKDKKPVVKNSPKIVKEPSIVVKIKVIKELVIKEKQPVVFCVKKTAEDATCKNGHLRTEENTKYRQNGQRYCGDCAKDSWTKQNEKKKLENELAGKTVGRPKTEVCPKGHAYTEENTYYKPNGGKECRICGRERNLKARMESEKYKDYTLQDGRLRKAMCPNGHEFTAENTSYQTDKDGYKTHRCNICVADGQAAKYQKEKANDAYLELLTAINWQEVVDYEVFS